MEKHIELYSNLVAYIANHLSHEGAIDIPQHNLDLANQIVRSQVKQEIKTLLDLDEAIEDALLSGLNSVYTLGVKAEFTNGIYHKEIINKVHQLREALLYLEKN